MTKVMLVQGLIFQKYRDIGIIERSLLSVDTLRLNSELIFQGMFSGIIANVEKGEMSGIVNDAWGQSELFNIVFNDSNLSFCKKYFRRDDIIDYKLKKLINADNVWVGDYDGKDTGKGIAWLTIQEVESDMWDYDYVESLINQLKFIESQSSWVS